jgi:glycosyltransferase involved in cell wall biosynthesis
VIALFNWRDLRHPAAGGAEVYTDAFLRVLVQAGHECTLVTANGHGLASQELHPNGYRILRMGSQVTCRFYAARWLHENRRDVELAIDEVNTLPFLSPLIVGKRAVLLIHQLAREVWWAEASPPLNLIGYLSEPAMLQIYRNVPTIALSTSTGRTLRDIGLRGELHVIEPPLLGAQRDNSATRPWRVGYLGRIAKSKRVDDIVRAIAMLVVERPETELVMVGTGAEREMERIRRLVRELGIDSHVRMLGRLPNAERDDVLSTLDVLAMASLREGWGLVVSEAARYAVPAVAYDVPGLRDSIRNGETGILVTEEKPRALAAAMKRLMTDRTLRDQMGIAAQRLLLDYSPDRFAKRITDAVSAFVARGR